MREPPEAPPMPTCPACMRTMGDGMPPQEMVGQTLKDAAKVRALVDRLEPEHRHRVRRILKNYELTTEIECMFPDKTPHRRGTVIETFCGKTINIGHECARRWCAGYRQAKLELNKAEAMASAITAIEQILSTLPKRITLLESRTARVLDFKSDCRRLAPKLSTEMVRRRAEGARGRAVLVPRRKKTASGKQTTDFDSVNLNGMEMWSSPSGDPPGELRKRLSESETRFRRADQEAIESRATSFRAQFERLEENVSERERWLDAAEQFLSAKNLALALIASGLHADHEAHDGYITCPKGVVGR